MNASLLAITNMLADSTRIGRTSSPALRPEVTSDTKSFSLNLTDNPKRPTTYNNITNNTKSDPMSTPKAGSPDFSGTFCKKAALQTPNEGPPPSAGRGTQSKDKIKAETKGSIRQRLNPAENPAPHETRTDTDLTQTATDVCVRPCIGAGASAQGSPITGATQGSHEAGFQLGDGFLLWATSPTSLRDEDATRHLAGQQQKEAKTPPIYGLQSSFGNRKLVVIKVEPSAMGVPKGLDAAAPHQLQSSAGTNRTTERDPKVSGSIGAGGSQKTTTAENPACLEQTDTTASSAGQKTAILNYSFPPVQRKSPNTEQNATIGPEKSAVIAKKPIDSASLVKSTNPPLGGPGRTYCKAPSEPLDSDKAKPSDNPGLNITMLQISTDQSKGGGSSPPKADRFSTAVSIRSAAAGASSIEFERSSILNQSANIANNTRLLQDVSKDISEQIVESIHTCLRQADKQITIRLNPPELGQVFLRFQEREAEITGLLEVSKAETRYEIEQALPQIIRTLTDYGVQIKRLDVLLTDQPESAPGGPGADSFEQGGSGNPPWVRHRWSEAVTDTYSYEDIGEPAQRWAESPLWRVTNGGINVLI